MQKRSAVAFKIDGLEKDIMSILIHLDFLETLRSCSKISQILHDCRALERGQRYLNLLFKSFFKKWPHTRSVCVDLVGS